MARSRAKPLHILEQLLEPRLAARLAAHCALTGDAPLDAVADAVDLHLDEAEGSAERAMLDQIVAETIGAPAEPKAAP